MLESLGYQCFHCTEYFHFAPGESGEGKLFLMSYEFGPCIARIPMMKLQELRGRVEHWANCNSAIGAEMGFIDKMLVSQDPGIGWCG